MPTLRPLASIIAFACGVASAAPYVAKAVVDAPIRVWGSPADEALLKKWEAAFLRVQPRAHISAELHGPDSAMAGIYTGVADLAFIGRELRLPVESMAFEWVRLHKPTVIDVANAGNDVLRASSNLAVFVHPDNPLAGLSLQQLDAIFGAEHKRGAVNARTWGDLGLVGDWAARPIGVLAPPVDSVNALYFRRVVLQNSFKWNPSLEEIDGDAQVLERLAHDRFSIAYAPRAAATAAVRPLPLAAANGGAFVPLNRQTATDRSYPLARSVHMAFDRAPGVAPNVAMQEFLRFVLSDEGQAVVDGDGAYLPLTPAQVELALRSLEP